MVARLALLLVTLAACCACVVRTAAAHSGDPGAAIVNRLSHAGFWVIPEVPGDYFGARDPLPQKAYAVYADERSAHAFVFTVMVYPTAAAAAAAYRYYSAWFAQKGTRRAYELKRAGRILYMGETGSISRDMHRKPPPSLPLEDFHALLAIAGGTL